MTYQNLVELVHMHHPSVPWSQIRLLAIQRMNRLCEQSGLLRGWELETTVANQVYYPIAAIDANIIDILKVRYDGSDIDRETDIPPHGTDTTLDTPITGE